MVYNELGVEEHGRAMYKDAVSLLNRAVAICDKEAVFYVNRGDCWRALKQQTHAEADYREALALARRPHVRDAVATRLALVHHANGTALYNTGQVELADVEFTHAIQLRDAVPHFYVARATSRYFQQRPAEALVDIKRALQLEPNNDEARKLLLQLGGDRGHQTNAFRQIDPLPPRRVVTRKIMQRGKRPSGGSENGRSKRMLAKA